jgi:hypothetical protein
MVYFQTKNPNLGKFWRVLYGRCGTFYDHLVYSTAIWYIMWSFGIIYGHLAYFSVPVLLFRLKSGNPDVAISSRAARPKLGRSVNETLHKRASLGRSLQVPEQSFFKNRPHVTG